jgi:hypothetical protein
VTSSAYPAGRTAAAGIRAHLRHETPAAPCVDAIEAMIAAAFWASLRREEGYLPRISLAFVAPDALPAALRFERPLPLAAQRLTKLAPAVERPGIHLGVARDDSGQFMVWGATRSLPPFSLVLEVVAPGLLVAKHSRGEPGKFVNIAVLEGDEVKMIDQESAHLPDCPDVLTSLLGFDTQHASSDSVSVLIQLAISMRAHGRGGSLLVVPAASERWRDSIIQPVTYALVPPFAGLAGLVRERSNGDPDVRRAIDGVAGLTAVDGATLIDDAYNVLAFGAKIVRRPKSSVVAEVILTEPIEGSRPDKIEPAQLGGTRHFSAAQFVQDQHDAVALVASQDGHFTVFAWSPCENMVHAHRIETLLL